MSDQGDGGRGGYADEGGEMDFNEDDYMMVHNVCYYIYLYVLAGRRRRRGP